MQEEEKGKKTKNKSNYTNRSCIFLKEILTVMKTNVVQYCQTGRK